LLLLDVLAVPTQIKFGTSGRRAVIAEEFTFLSVRLAGLLCREAVARRGKSLKEQLQAISNQVGSFYPQRDNFRLTPEVKTKFTEKLRSDPVAFCGRGVSEVVHKDGLKLFGAGS